MSYSRPPGLVAGFHAQRPEPDVPELLHIGEQWVPRRFAIPAHTHSVWEFYLQSDGESRWDGPGRTYALAPGSFFAAPPGVTHTLHDALPARHHFFFAAIDLATVTDRLPQLAPPWRRDSIVFVPQGQSLLAPFRHLVREVSLALPHRALGIRTALDALVVEASRLLEQSGRGLSLVAVHPAVLRARELLEHQPGAPWSLADLARRAGVSPNHLAECFTRDVGISPHRYLLQVRIARAREMLSQSDVPITDLALELGFASSQHFAATFKRLTGQTAREYRRALGV